MGKAKSRWAGLLLGSGVLWLPAILALALLWVAPTAAAQTPYEPNDALQLATGALTAGQQYSAALETAGDRDYFFFYVTSAQSAQVELTVQNLGGGSMNSDIDITILDTSATPLAAQTFIRDGEARVVPVELEPQKYFVEVSANEGSGDSYSLTGGGGAGAFGSYAQISGRCSSATTTAARRGKGLSRAKSKLQRATARLRRSRYTTATARQQARSVHRDALHQVAAKRRGLREARLSREPWCSIAP